MRLGDAAPAARPTRESCRRLAEGLTPGGVARGMNRQFVIHDDLKPPQTTSRRADLEMRLHRRLCRTEIPATEHSMLLTITGLSAQLTSHASALILMHGTKKSSNFLIIH